MDCDGHCTPEISTCFPSLYQGDVAQGNVNPSSFMQVDVEGDVRQDNHFAHLKYRPACLACIKVALLCTHVCDKKTLYSHCDYFQSPQG